MSVILARLTPPKKRVTPSANPPCQDSVRELGQDYAVERIIELK